MKYRRIPNQCMYCLGVSTRPRSWYCGDCDRTLSAIYLEAGKKDAERAVLVAIREGRLPPANTLQCADCDRPASCYDHRDYSRPLEIDAVCNGCNGLRGRADNVVALLDKYLPNRIYRPFERPPTHQATA